jgi:hypothetical protein
MEPKKRGRKPKNKEQHIKEIKIPKKRGRKPKNIVSENNENYVFDINNNNFNDLNKLNLILHLKINSNDIKKNLDDITPYSIHDNYCKFNNDIIKNNDNIDFKINVDDKSKKFLEKYNNNYITQNVYNNYNNFLNSKNDWPKQSKLHCLWCVHQFNTIPCGIPRKYINGKFELEGHFCSFNCAMAHLYDKNDYNKWEKISLLKLLYTKIFNKRFNIKPAPKREILKIFGGILDIDDFRKNFNEININYKIYIPPLLPIVSKIEYIKNDNDETNIKPINDNLMNIANEKYKSSNKFDFQNNNFNLSKIN